MQHRQFIDVNSSVTRSAEFRRNRIAEEIKGTVFLCTKGFRKKEGALFPTFEISFSPPFTRGSALYGAPGRGRADICVCECV